MRSRVCFVFVWLLLGGRVSICSSKGLGVESLGSSGVYLGVSGLGLRQVPVDVFFGV